MKTLLLLLCLSFTTAVFAIPVTLGTSNPSPLSGGPGVGIMYGKLGANLEYRLSHQISLTAGLGLDGEGGWFAGGRMYFKPDGGRGPRGRFTVGVGEIDTGGHFSHNGAVLGIGWSWANAGNDFHGPSIDVTTLGDISVGYQF